MADVMVGVRGYLLSRTAITELVGQRIYTDIMPQNATLPAVAFSKRTTRHERTLSGFAGIAHCRLQFDCYAATRLQANYIAEAIRASGIIRVKGMTFGVDIRGARVEDGQRNEVEYSNENSDDHRYVTSLDLEIDYSETE